jgi:Tfp pilus assembly protein PilF
MPRPIRSALSAALTATAFAALAALPAAAAPHAAAPHAAAADGVAAAGARSGPPSPFAADAAIRAAGERIGRLPGGVRDKADAVLDFIFDGERGLGFDYRAYPTRTAAEAFAAKNGNCLSLVNLYLALGRSAGLDAFPVEVEDFQAFSRHGGTVVRATHVVGGLWVNGVVYTVDFLPDRPKTYRRMDRIGDHRHAALVYNALATEAMLGGEPERAGELYRAALGLEPENAEAWNNYAVHAKRGGDLATARQRLERSLAADPHFLPALNNLAAIERRAGRIAAAEALEAAALEQKAQSPYFLTEQALRQARAGRFDEAESLLIRARRIDRNIPEIHLALGRIELARGHAGRAEAHFAEARKRSQPLSDVYREKLDVKIGKLTQLAAAR